MVSKFRRLAALAQARGVEKHVLVPQILGATGASGVAMVVGAINAVLAW
jgi:hypothetical protein